MEFLDKDDLQTGEEVYVIYHNPHTPTAANVRPAEVVQHPKDPNALALFINDTFFVIEDDDALFRTEADAEAAFNGLYDDEQYT